MKHNFFGIGDRVMRIEPWLGVPIEKALPIEIGAVHFITAILDRRDSFLFDVCIIDDRSLWGGQWVHLDHPFFEVNPDKWIHANSLRLLAPKAIVDVTAFEYCGVDR